MIAIKDFKMPENCLKCPMQFGGWCYVSPPEVDEKVAPTVDEAWEQGKPDWCPLVDVPDMNVGKCSEIPNNSDCVSKRAAVEAIANQSRFSAEEIINICDKSVQDENGWLGGLKEAILAVLELPSAQPEFAKDTNVTTNDLIDRQAAIDVLIHKWDGMVTSVFDVLKELPSAQPEIIRCKDCRWYLEDEYGGWCTEVHESPAEENGYCNYAERKTDGSD